MVIQLDGSYELHLAVPLCFVKRPWLRSSCSRVVTTYIHDCRGQGADARCQPASRPARAPAAAALRLLGLCFAAAQPRSQPLSRRAAQENQSPSVAARIKSAMRSPAKPEVEETKSWHEEGKGAAHLGALSNVARLRLSL